MTNPATSNPAETSILSRRRFFIAGGATALGAATLAACGRSSVVNSSGSVASTSVPPTAPPTTAPKEAVAAGRSILRTMTSVETSLAAFYTSLAAATYLAADAQPWVTAFGAHHTANASALADLTVRAGGKAFAGPNKYLDQQLIAPARKAADAQSSSDNLIELAAQLEATGAATGTIGISTLTEPELRQGVTAVTATDSRHAYLWRLMVTPGKVVDALPDALLSLRDALPAKASVDPAPTN
ncbi:MAG: ferritin-like domain-containing protein [Actinobacteria bacterium]|nr:ferritin-like domain-containing protein [Actinomycetota bacterium]